MSGFLNRSRSGSLMVRWTMAFLALVAALGAVSAPEAHEGHDHGAPPTPISTTIAPRIDASSTTFELIAVYRNNALTVFVDRFVTNEPVTSATVEVDTPKGTVAAKENADGTYVLPAEWAKAGGSYDLIFTVTAGADIDVLTGTLKLSGEETAAQVVSRRPGLWRPPLQVA